ncbi:hypothetical protein AX14_004625 [Amanita brunnescens Koide BX004]|nr:hypothetical protein AX14_004625 [Amanita brunnescens Koide BX004]
MLPERHRIFATMLSFFPQGNPHLLPSARTLLVTGNYHSSALIHFTLSFLAHNAEDNVLILTESRDALISSLTLLDTDFIFPGAQRGLAQQILLSSQVNFMYPPTAAQLVVLLSCLTRYNGRVPETSTKSRPMRPSLLILHELSTYLKPSTIALDQPWTVSSYLSMIMPALSACSSLGDVQANPTSLVLFESRLGHIRLPVFRQPAFNLAATQGSETQAFHHPLEKFVKKYFELTCTFEDDLNYVPSSQNDDFAWQTKKRRMQICLNQTNEQRAISWYEARERYNGMWYTRFVWE